MAHVSHLILREVVSQHSCYCIRVACALGKSSYATTVTRERYATIAERHGTAPSTHVEVKRFCIGEGITQLTFPCTGEQSDTL